MTGAVNAILGRSAEVDEISARITDARRERVAEIARARNDPNTASATKPPPAARVESARPVEAPPPSAAGRTAKQALAQPLENATRPALSSTVRGMLLSSSEPPPPPASGSARLIGELLDALRAYEKRAG